MTRPRFRPLALAGAFVIAGCQRGAQPPGFPGTIEVNESDAAPLIGGRVLEVRVDEGDSVAAGDTLALLTQSNLSATVAERRARLAAARARLADLERGSRGAELDRASAELAAAEAEAIRTAGDLSRGQKLVQDEVIAAQEFDRIKTAAEAAARRRDAARATLELAREGSRTDQIHAAAAEVRSAEALLRGANADLQELAVLAAVPGVILGRHAEPGEVVAAGTPLVTVGEVARPWVRVYLSAALLATLPAGTRATVSLAGGDSVLAIGRLASVNPRAEFTPRAALTEQERADLLFASRVELDHPPAVLRPGLPVTVRFTAELTP